MENEESGKNQGVNAVAEWGNNKKTLKIHTQGFYVTSKYKALKLQNVIARSNRETGNHPSCRL